VAAAWEAGVRYFDTAPFYGLGLAERRLGQAHDVKAPRSSIGVLHRLRLVTLPR
jgi:D-threo-aldose 1-dehydrogenase